MNENENPTLSDFPKIHCPFIRQIFKVNRAQWKEHGAKLKLRRDMFDWFYSDKIEIYDFDKNPNT